VTATPDLPLVGDVWGDTRRPSRRGITFDLVVAGLFTLLFGLVEASVSRASLTATLLLGLAMALRRTWLLAMLAAAFAASLVQLIGGQVAVFGDAAYALLFFTLGAHPSPVVRRFGMACVAVSAVVAGVWTGMRGGTGTGQSAVFAGVGMAALATVVTGGGWVAGFVRRQRRQQVQARVDAGLAAVERRRLEELVAQAQERGRIAADMHDVVAHSWAVVAAQADGARYVLRTDPDRAEQALGVIGETARSAMSDVRGLLTRLRSRDEPPSGADDARHPLPDTDDVLARMLSAGMEVQFSRHGEPDTGGTIVSVARYALAESLTNALKHGDLGRPVAVVEDWRDGYRLRVDNPLGPKRSPEDNPGHGLLGMSERVTELGGTLTAGRCETRWVVEVSIPGAAP
jgi:signal transduction histidine kinase